MGALDAMARATRRATFHVWARELAVVAHRAFVHGPLQSRRMAWKMSIDLSRALVPSMGQHDPLDGYVTCLMLDATAAETSMAATPSLAAARADFAAMIDPGRLATADPLGIGGLLLDAWRLIRIDAERELSAALLAAAAHGTAVLRAGTELRTAASSRLAFRELGLAIGLSVVALIRTDVYGSRLLLRAKDAVAVLAELAPLGEEIVAFWLRPDHRQTGTWRDHADINDVMLATALVPDSVRA
jgi:hypothetical protein